MDLREHQIEIWGFEKSQKSYGPGSAHSAQWDSRESSPGDNEPFLDPLVPIKMNVVYVGVIILAVMNKL